MKTVFAIIGFVVVALVIGTCAFCGDDDDHNRNSFGPVTLVSHQRDDCDQDWDDCDDGGNYGDGNYGQGHNSGGGGGNGNRGRKGDHQRSGRDSCHSFCGNTVVIPMPGETTTTTRGEQ